MEWRETLEQIRSARPELAALAPATYSVMAPRDGATLRTISLAERRMGRRLPRTYREFLHLHDGWELFFGNTSLLGTHEIVQARYSDLSRSVFEAYETPIPEVGPRARPEGRPDAMIPFGIDPEATTLFAFNPAVVRPDGEMEVIAWVNGLGERYEAFGEFLASILELIATEVAFHREWLSRSA
jgi:hypothetical protein